MNNIFLNNCPLCGSVADFVEIYVNNIQNKRIWIECNNCCAKSTSVTFGEKDIEEGHMKEIKKFLAGLWNKRV